MVFFSYFLASLRATLTARLFLTADLARAFLVFLTNLTLLTILSLIFLKMSLNLFWVARSAVKRALALASLAASLLRTFYRLS